MVDDVGGDGSDEGTAIIQAIGEANNDRNGDGIQGRLGYKEDGHRRLEEFYGLLIIFKTT